MTYFIFPHVTQQQFTQGLLVALMFFGVILVSIIIMSILEWMGNHGW